MNPLIQLLFLSALYQQARGVPNSMRALYALRTFLVNNDVELHVAIEQELHELEKRLPAHEKNSLRQMNYSFPEDWDSPMQWGRRDE